MQNIHSSKILILDFGSQYTQLIARRIREMGVYCEIYPWQISKSIAEKINPVGIILSGGPESVHIQDAPKIPQWVFEYKKPILGICYGMQALVENAGGKVVASSEHEFGFAEVGITSSASRILTQNLNGALDGKIKVWMSHGDRVENIPAGFEIIASTPACPIAAIENAEKQIYGLQFHPEVSHTEDGMQILQNFVLDICSAQKLWLKENIIEDLKQKIAAQVGDKKVLLGLSGGVDSSVVAALLHSVIGDQLTCVFVDHGLLRQNEAEEVLQTFAKNMGVNIIYAQSEELFLQKLKGISDPEQKRKIIGNTFIEVFDEKAQQLKDISFLAQGTIYPDVIESAGIGDGAKVIKSHHNVGGLPEKMNLQLVEPLRELFKDEVRQIGLALGLPKEMIYRHPFPGPGLGVRILGEISKDKADILRQADAIFINALSENGFYDQVSQAFAVFLPIKSVGVVGDNRRYSYVIALRAVKTTDFMTATWADLPASFLGDVSRNIINKIPQVSRVVYDISDKPPATIEWE